MGQAGSYTGKQAMTKDELKKIVSFLESVQKEIYKHAERLSINQGMGWQQEYAQFAAIQGVSTVSFQPENAMKNRYRNISAYDHSRVKLKPNQYNFNSDYINANYVNGYAGQNYIAAQGPVPDSFYSFWQMVWESGSNVVAMVTNEIEGGKLKCHRYWPEETNTEMVVGNFRIVSGPARVTPAFVKKIFLLQETVSGESREITHFRYTAWPDHGVPNTASEMLSFRKAVLKASKTDVLIIHCSAGVGRTGTYIAIDILIRMIEAGQTRVDPCSIVCDLRKARNFMVQTLVQYQFVFKAIIEAIHKRLTRAKNALIKVEGKSSDADKESARLDEMKDLEAEIAEAEDSIVNLQNIDEEVEAKMREELTADGHKRGSVIIQADVRAEDKVDDKSVAAHVTTKQRHDSLMAYVSSEDWRGEQPIPKGHAPLSARMHSLQLSTKAALEQWQTVYDREAAAWNASAGGEEYDLSRAFTPLQSRLVSIEQQRQVMATRPEEVRKQLEAQELSRISSLQSRFQELAQVRATSEDRVRHQVSRGSGTQEDLAAATQTSKVHSLRDRLMALTEVAYGDKDYKSRINEGRVVSTPVKKTPEIEVNHPTLEELQAQQEAEEAAFRAEQERKAREEEERRKNEPPVKATEFTKKSPVYTPAVQLRKVESNQDKASKPHPMVAAAMAGKHPQARK